jgi:hypothetical protein
MHDPHGDAGAATFAASRDGACDGVQLLRRIGQGDEDAMAAFYRLTAARTALSRILTTWCAIAGWLTFTR